MVVSQHWATVILEYHTRLKGNPLVNFSRFSKSNLKKWRATGLLIMGILLRACSANTPTTISQPSVSPDPISTISIFPEAGIGTGEITGVIEQVVNRWPDTKVFVFAASFEGDTIDQGYYYLESSLSPSCEVDTQGHFDLSNIPAGHYILVVGPSAEESIRLVNLDQQYFLVEVIVGNIVDLGTLLMAN
jgi:hypothetical protein